ncbi:hypothetical protein [Nosocomiicoccus ampullae]|uniref:hypothetical protein n=1 Tax=Nosocomiicoccus ampullae TaxID=489910 RepID=UPI00254EA20D|nr:hypothetical protein [Nosocomiicoccus ampullae]
MDGSFLIISFGVGYIKWNTISWGKYKIHYEIGAGDYESKGFMLPTKLHVLIDVEDKETRTIMIKQEHLSNITG